MLDSAKMLQNVSNVNTFDTVPTVTVLGGSDTVNIYLRLFQSDRKERYVPETGSTLTVTFPRALTVNAEASPGPTSQDVTKSATTPFTTDTSIWLVTLNGTAAPDEVDTVTSGGFIVTLTEPTAGIITFFVKNAIVKKVNPTTGV
jgi:hypothetical protein